MNVSIHSLRTDEASLSRDAICRQKQSSSDVRPQQDRNSRAKQNSASDMLKQQISTEKQKIHSQLSVLDRFYLLESLCWEKLFQSGQEQPHQRLDRFVIRGAKVSGENILKQVDSSRSVKDKVSGGCDTITAEQLCLVRKQTEPGRSSFSAQGPSADSGRVQ